MDIMNFNTLSKHKYKVLIKRSKPIEFFVKKISIPSITLPKVNTPTPFKTIPQVGDHLEYEYLKMSFLIDEDLKNYRDLVNWMKDTGRNKNFEQFANLKTKNNSFEDNGLFSEISIISYTNMGNPNIVFTFNKCFPVNLSGWDYDIDVNDSEPSYLTAEFAFIDFNIEKC